MMDHRRSQFTPKLPLLLMIVCCAALIRCVQLDGDTGATGVPGDVGSEKAWGQAERISDLSAPRTCRRNRSGPYGRPRDCCGPRW